MFFKQSVLKRLFKNAYKGAGLTVGHELKMDGDEVIREGYYVAGGYWLIWVDAEHITKETKAAIIELCGDLPGPGEVFKAYKDLGNQYEIEQKEIYSLPERFKEAKTHFKVSKMILEGDGVLNRLLQAEDATYHVTAINEVFMDLIDYNEIDYDNGEWEPEGPVADCAMGKMMYWGNNVCYLMACIRVLDNPEVVEYLEHLEGKEII